MSKYSKSLVSFVGTYTLICSILKIIGFIGWSWLAVFFPVIALFTAGIIAFGIWGVGMLAYLISKAINKKVDYD